MLGLRDFFKDNNGEINRRKGCKTKFYIDMKYILLVGDANVGKTTAINSVYNWLKIKGYNVLDEVPLPRGDFRALIEKEGTKVVVNSASDNCPLIDDLQKFHPNEYDVLISSCRTNEDAVKLYDYFYENIVEKTDEKNVIEIPMAKINKHRKCAASCATLRSDYNAKIVTLTEYVFKAFVEQNVNP